MAWAGKDFKDHFIPNPSHEQVHLQTEEVAQSPIQPGFEHLHEWDIHNFPGNLFQCLTTLTEKNFISISNITLPSLSLKLFPLALSLPTFVPYQFSWNHHLGTGRCCKSPCSLFFSRLDNPNSLNLSSQEHFYSVNRVH